MKYDLFISHSSADADTARTLVTDFENRGITCWIAPRDIPMGSSYQSEIVRAIEECRAVLLLFSKSTNESEHVLREVELAAQGRKAIYPLRIDATEPAGGLRYMLANKQWVERKALGNRLVDTIEQLLANTGATPRPAAATAAARPPNRMPLIAGGAIAACLVLGIGAYLMLGPKPAQVAVPAPPSSPVTPAPAPATPDPPKEIAVVPPAPAPDPAPASTPSPPPAADNPPAAPALPASTPMSADILKKAPTAADAVPGKSYFKECDMCPLMVVVPSGSNTIGSPVGERGRSSDEGPPKNIAISQPFAVGRSEIAFEEYLACIAEGGCNPDRPGDYDWGYDRQPAINVSWNDAKAYVEWLSKKTGGQYRLLSEAEWEYVARACAKVCASTPFWFGMDISRARANYNTRSAYNDSPRAQPLNRTVPIDTGEANPFGLLNVHGNVREWVEDCWNPTLDTLPGNAAPRTTGDCTRHVWRGGSWSDEPKDIRSAKRGWEVTGERRAQLGFRVARDLSH